MKLLRISLSLTQNGFEWERTERDAEAKGSVYMMESLIKGFPTRIIHTDSLMRPSLWLTNACHVEYSIWCLPEDEEKAKALLNEKVLTTARQIKEEADKLVAHLSRN